MAWVTSALGAALVVAIVWDVFQTLWNPSGQGRLTHAAMSAVWRTSRRLGRRAMLHAGPVAMLGVIGSWGLVVVLGGALVYWPHLPGAFSYSPGLDPGAGVTFLDALYLSLVTLVTLGFGDIVPTVAWLRLVTPLQALLGFGLLTAAVTWVLQVYPALVRRRTVSLRLAALRSSEALSVLGELSGTTAARVLDDVSTGITQARVDLTQYTESYYFQERSPDSSLPLTVGYAADLARAGVDSGNPDLRLAARALSHTLDDLAQVIDAQFLRTGGTTDAVLEAYATDSRPRGGPSDGQP